MFETFLSKINNHRKIGVISHIRPDGDCIGSQIALCRWLRDNGYSATAFNDDDIPENLHWMLPFYRIEKPDETLFDECDLFILVDGNATHRFGAFADWLENNPRPVWIIDHHPNPDDGFEVAISEVKASSTCELIYQLYEEHDINQIDEETAKALYTGIITDTGSLQFDSVTPQTVEITANLLRIGGFKPNEIAEAIYSNKTIAQIKLLGLSLETIELFENNQIAIMCVTPEMLQDTGTTYSDCEGFVNYPLSIENVKAAILLKDHGDEGVRMSLRSRSSVDVNIWARKFGGGGHKKAAGAWHKGPLKTAIKEVVSIGSNQL